jgi:hypothetical protein
LRSLYVPVPDELRDRVGISRAADYGFNRDSAVALTLRLVNQNY